MSGAEKLLNVLLFSNISIPSPSLIRSKSRLWFPNVFFGWETLPRHKPVMMLADF